MTDAQWDATHSVDPKYPNEKAYLPFVNASSEGPDEFTAVDHTGGRVVGWNMAFPEGTPLAAAEQTMLNQLPPDTRVTATFNAKSTDGTAGCVFVNYQSGTLSQWLAPNPWGDAEGGASAAFYQVNADGSSALETDTVNSANVDIAPVTSDTTC